jgi:hypothetical protein
MVVWPVGLPHVNTTTDLDSNGFAAAHSPGNVPIQGPSREKSAAFSHPLLQVDVQI